MEYKTTTKLKQSTLGQRPKVNHDTQYYRIKGGGGVPPSPSSPMTFERVDEIL